MTKDVDNLAFTHQENPLVSPNWSIYFGAFNDMNGWNDWFYSFDDNANPIQVLLDNDTSHDIHKKGNIHIYLEKNIYQIKEILYVPRITKNLISMIQMLDNNLKVEFDIVKGQKVYFIRGKSRDWRIVMKAQGVGRNFFLYVVASNN